jgi:hypothetical protein
MQLQAALLANAAAPQQDAFPEPLAATLLAAEREAREQVRQSRWRW